MTRVLGLFVLLAGGVLAAQQAPTFKLAVAFVEVDAVVTDRAGNFVHDLKREDFQVFEDNKAQAITAFSIVDIPVERSQRPLFASAPIEPDVRTNERPFDGRIYVMLVDDMQTNALRTQRVKTAGRLFIQQHFGANDLMAVVHTAGGAKSAQDFTSNKALLLAAVDKTVGRKMQSPTLARTEEFNRPSFQAMRVGNEAPQDPYETERAHDARQSLEALRDIAEWFATISGRRKTILFLSEGIDYDVTDWVNNRSSFWVSETTRETIAAATRANVAIYGIDPRGMTQLDDESITVSGFPPESLGIGQQSLNKELLMANASLRELSEQTGGFAVVNTSQFASAFNRIVSDNSTYYVLAYYPPPDKPGKFHNIQVKVTRPGLTVRARRGYMTPKPVVASLTRSAKDAPADSARLMTPEIKAALDSPIPVNGLAMRVFATPFKGTAPNASVLIGVEMRGKDLRLTTGDKLVMTCVAMDTDGKVRDGKTDVITMSLQPGTKTRVAETAFRMLNRLELPPGRYQLRVAAQDEGGGNIGSVLYDLDVPDFAKTPFSMSGIVLTSLSGATAPTGRMDEELRPLLPAPPVALRDFPQNDELALFVEVYDNDGERLHKVDITSTVTSDEGKVLYKNDETRDSTDIQGKHGGYGYTTRIPLSDLPPGLYVLTVSAQSRLGNRPAVERQVQFSVRAPLAPAR